MFQQQQDSLTAQMQQLKQTLQDQLDDRNIENDMRLHPASLTEKMEAIRKWTIHKQRHEKKKKKSSHVYMHRETVEDGPKILQEYRWHCMMAI
ncbi:hypothetical protein V8E54_000365 [Elaphomyces granulatus]